MRIDKPSDKYTSKQIFNEIGAVLKNGSNNKNATNYTAVKSLVETAIDNYDLHVLVTPNTLNQLNAISTSVEEHTTLYNMYTTKREQIIDLRNDLLRINGAGKVYKCPLCLIEDVNHLDHYIPRSLMPEFSVVPHNLIFICDKCNKVKYDQWLDNNNNRVCFNSYYDKPSGLDVLVSTIDQLVDGMPYARVIENPDITHTPESILELSTYINLGIIERYESAINEHLKQECVRIRHELIHNIHRLPSKIWKGYVGLYKECVDDNDTNVINKYLYDGLITSPIMLDWIKDEMKEIRKNTKCKCPLINMIRNAVRK